MKYLICLILLFPVFLSAQEKPIFFPEDVGPNTVGLRCYCKPGVIGKSKSRGIDISYKYTGTATVLGEDEPLQKPYSQIKNHQSIVFKLKAPIINRPGFKLLFGYNHQPEAYNFRKIGAPDFSNQFSYINGQRLKNNAISLTSVNSFTSSYFSAKFKVAFNGDYNSILDFKKRYLVYNLIGVYGIKKRDDLEWGFGISASHSFRKNIIIPFLIYNRTFNEKWGFETILPALVMARYNINHEMILLGGLEFNSKSFSITTPDPIREAGNIYHLNHSEVNGLLRLERHLVPWLWMSAEVGYQFNFSTDFESKNEALAPSFKVEAKDNFFFKFGFFISPPDHFFR